VQPLLGQIVAEKERTRVILDNSNDAFIALGPQGLVTDWNRQAETMFGWSSAEAMGGRLSELIIPPEQRRAHEDGLQRFAATGTGTVIDRRIEVMAMRRDGSQFPVEMSITAYRDGQGHVSNAFMRDITQRRAAEERLQSSEKRLRDITDNLPVLISYIDHEQRFTFVNQTIGRWMGVDPVAAIGQRCAEVMTAQIYEQRAPYIARALAGERVSFELSTRMQDVERDLSNEYIPDRRADGSVAGIYVLSTDVSELKKVQRTLVALARYDTLTGLPNRLLFNEKLQEAIARSARSQQPLALMFLDVDHFKSINDSLGHAAGDLVLQSFAARLRTSVRETDTVARLAGDEFVVVLEGLHSTAEPQFVARKILSQIAREFDIEGRKLQVTTSIGVAYHDSGTVQPAQLLALADKALYEAKAAGRNTFALAAAPTAR
jgi:diguanylate cyclase (GGDEF)-like protein/PAS domain S-box-containing protein